MDDFYVYKDPNSISITMFDLNDIEGRQPVLFSTISAAHQERYWDAAVTILLAEYNGTLKGYAKGRITKEHCDMLRTYIREHFFKDEDEN